MSCVGVSSISGSGDCEWESLLTVIVSSSVERILLGTVLRFCWDAAVAQVLSVLSEGVVS